MAPAAPSSSLVDGADSSCVEGLVDPSLYRILRDAYPVLLPLQSKLLPLLLSPHAIHNPRDLVCTASTGSGKTLCFLIPILNSILKTSGGCTVAVVVLPTTNLAQQVFKDFSRFTEPLNISLSLDSPTSKHLSSSIVVTTPGGVKRRFEGPRGDEWANTLRWIVTGGRWTLVANLMYGLLCFSHVMRSISTVQKARNLRSCEGGDGAAS